MLAGGSCAARQWAHPSAPTPILCCAAQMAALKDKMAVLLRKTHNDDRLIAALRTELAAVAAHSSGAARHIHGSVLGVDRWVVGGGRRG